MPTPENLALDAPKWQISSACDIQLGPMVKELSTAGLDISLDVDHAAVQEILERLGPQTTPQHDLYIELTHGQSLPAATFLGLYTLEEDQNGKDHSTIRIRMNVYDDTDDDPTIFNQNSINETLVHELQHAVDHNDPAKKFLKRDLRRSQFENIKSKGLCLSVAVGTAVLGNSMSIHFLKEGSAQMGGFLASYITSAAIFKKISEPVFGRIESRTYKKSPLERRARIAELSAPEMPTAIMINHQQVKRAGKNTPYDVELEPTS